MSYLRKDADGYLVYLNSTNKTELYGDAHVLISFRVPEDGTALEIMETIYSASTMYPNYHRSSQEVTLLTLHKDLQIM